MVEMDELVMKILEAERHLSKLMDELNGYTYFSPESYSQVWAVAAYVYDYEHSDYIKYIKSIESIKEDNSSASSELTSDPVAFNLTGGQ